MFLRGRIMPTFGSVVSSLETRMNSCYGAPRPPRHKHCGQTNYKYSWSRSVFPKMFSINKPLWLFFTSRSNPTYVSEGKTKCQLEARRDKANIANCRRKIPLIFRVTFGNFSDIYILYYTISRGNHIVVVWNTNWQTSSVHQWRVSKSCHSRDWGRLSVAHQQRVEVDYHKKESLH
jgi:hypothetical protein